MSKPTYAPVPARAMCDTRLSERHLRTLMVVAAHDRLGVNGIGCWASHDRLAAMVGCAYNRLSMNLRELGEYGYLERVEHPLNKRLRVYRVIYTEEDALTMKEVKKGVPKGSPDGEGSSPDSSPDGEQTPPDSSPHMTQFSNDFNGDGSENIFRKAGNRLGGNLKIDTPEGARPNGRADDCQQENGSFGEDISTTADAPPDGEDEGARQRSDREIVATNLRRLSAYLKAGDIERLNLADWREFLEDTLYGEDNTLANWAGRLLEDLALEEGYDGEGDRRAELGQ